MPDDLVTPDDLAGYPGAPFTADVVAAAGAAVRSIAGWHIAPVRTETLTVDYSGGRRVYLPTKYLTSVTEVRDVSGDTPVILTGWRASVAGRLSLSWGAVCGLAVLEVDVVHGYAECPPELLPIIAGHCLSATTDQDVSQESLGSWSTTYRDQSAGDDGDNVPAALAALSLAWGAA